MTWLLLTLCCIAFVEVVVRLDITGQVRAATLVTRRVLSIIGSSRVSDHWKERVLPIYAWRLLATSVRLLMIMLAAVAPIVLLTALSGWRDSPFLQLVSSWPGILAATFIAVVYAASRSRLVR